jgi:signal peptidase II
VKKIFARNLSIKKILQNFCFQIIQKILLKNFFFTNFSRWFFLGIVIAAIICFLDLLTKKLIFNLIDQYWQDSQIISLLDISNNDSNNNELKILSFFSLVKVWNKGVSFGMFNQLKNSDIIFSIIQGSIGLILLFWLYQVKKPYLAVALGLVIGGAFGNTLDRFKNGAVADFLDFHIATYHWPAFNLADSAIFIGIAILLCDEFIFNKKIK